MSIRNAEVQTGAVHIGSPDFSRLGIPQVLPTGLLTCPGISIFGGKLPNDVPTAAVSIGTPMALSAPFSFEVFGVSNFVGDTFQLGLYQCDGNSTFNGTHTVNATSTTNANKTVNGTFTVNGNSNLNGTTRSRFRGSINSQGWKGFDIEHPTKKNHRLRYVCLEGPEGGVYHRGILKDSEFIELPDYWKDLVDTKTITVHLTPIATYQYLYYTVAKNRIIVKNHSNLPTHCSYIVYGERKDGERLIPEYEGNSPEDYPGKNDQYSIAGYHYDRRTL